MNNEFETENTGLPETEDTCAEETAGTDLPETEAAGAAAAADTVLPETEEAQAVGTDSNAAEVSDAAFEPLLKALEERRNLSWDFSRQLEEEKAAAKAEGKKGALTYSVIVTCLFIVCFAILAGLLIYGSVHGFSPLVRTVYEDRIVYVHEDPAGSGMLSPQEIAEKVIPSTVGVQVQTSSGVGTGTGIVLDREGYIVTNYHVIEKQISIRVIMKDSKEFPATLIGGDEPSDIAVIKIEPGDYALVPAEFGNSDNLLVADSVIAIGNAGGLDLFGTVTKGVVSGVKRDIKFYDENNLVEKRMTLIQTDANINPGNSGGPLVDMYGKVIGINFMKYVAEKFEGIGFAIPANGALEIIREVKETGHYTGHAVAEKGVSLGITGTVVMKGQIIEDLRIVADADGVMVVTVTDENSSAYGYLQPGDVIVALNGNPIVTVEDIRTRLSGIRVGEVVTLTVVRNLTRTEIAIPMK